MRVLKPVLVATLQLLLVVAGLLPPDHVHAFPSTHSQIVHRHLRSHHDHAGPASVPAPDDDHDHVLTLDTLVACRATSPQLHPPALTPKRLTCVAEFSWVGDVTPLPPTPTASPPRTQIASRAPPA